MLKSASFWEIKWAYYNPTKNEFSPGRVRMEAGALLPPPVSGEEFRLQEAQVNNETPPLFIRVAQGPPLFAALARDMTPGPLPQ